MLKKLARLFRPTVLIRAACAVWPRHKKTAPHRYLQVKRQKPSYVLSRDEITHGFTAVLGRPPEAKDIIQYDRQQYRSMSDLVQALVETKEFSKREKNLPPSARVILRRTIMRTDVFGN